VTALIETLDHAVDDGAEEDEAEPKMGLRVDQKLEMDPSFYSPPSSDRPLRRDIRALRGLRTVAPAADDDSDDDDEDETADEGT